MHLDFAGILNNLNLKNVRFCLGTLSPAQYPHERPANPWSMEIWRLMKEKLGDSTKRSEILIFFQNEIKWTLFPLGDLSII